MTDHELKIGAWLKKDDSRVMLETLARSIYFRMQASGHTLEGIDTELLELSDIEQELSIFLLNDENLAATLVSGGRSALPRVKKMLWNKVIDKSREKENNQDIYKKTWNLFYRNTLRALGNSDAFIKTVLPSKIILFSLSDLPCRTVFTVDDLMDIPYPGGLPANFKEVNKKSTILELALHFWKAAAAKTGDPGIRLSVPDFITWIKAYVPIQAAVTVYPRTVGTEDDPNPLMDHAGMPGWDIDSEKEDLLNRFARAFALGLEEMEKRTFFYRQCKDMPRKETAERAGTEVKETDKQLKNIREKFRTFMRPLEYLAKEFTEDREYENDFNFFMDGICRSLGTSLGQTYP